MHPSDFLPGLRTFSVSLHRSPALHTAVAGTALFTAHYHGTVAIPFVSIRVYGEQSTNLSLNSFPLANCVPISQRVQWTGYTNWF